MPPRPSTTAGFDDQFELSQSSIFRLETLQSYGNSGEDPALEAFLAGRPHLITPGKQEWISLVRDRVSSGCHTQRIHVIIEPLTAYLRFELTWGYAPNVQAGEDIGIIPVHEGLPWPAELSEATDFWLFDASVLYGMCYGPDGTWQGVELITDHDQVAQACRWRDAARKLAIPWRHYVNQQPSLARHVAEVPQVF